MTQAGEESRALATRAAKGDESAFEELVRRHHGLVWRIALRMTGHPEDAMDLVQETFVAVFRHLDRYQPERAFEPWLTTIATRLSLNWLRSRRRRPVRPVDFAETVVRDPRPGPEAAAEDRDLVEAIGQLPPTPRAIVVLHYCEGLKLGEIAEHLEMSLSAVKVSLHRARKSLRDILRRRESGHAM